MSNFSIIKKNLITKLHLLREYRKNNNVREFETIVRCCTVSLTISYTLLCCDLRLYFFPQIYLLYSKSSSHCQFMDIKFIIPIENFKNVFFYVCSPNVFMYY